MIPGESQRKPIRLGRSLSINSVNLSSEHKLITSLKRRDSSVLLSQQAACSLKSDSVLSKTYSKTARSFFSSCCGLQKRESPKELDLSKPLEPLPNSQRPTHILPKKTPRHDTPNDSQVAQEFDSFFLEEAPVMGTPFIKVPDLKQAFSVTFNRIAMKDVHHTLNFKNKFGSFKTRLNLPLIGIIPVTNNPNPKDSDVIDPLDQDQGKEPVCPTVIKDETTVGPPLRRDTIPRIKLFSNDPHKDWSEVPKMKNRPRPQLLNTHLQNLRESNQARPIDDQKHMDAIFLNSNGTQQVMKETSLPHKPGSSRKLSQESILKSALKKRSYFSPCKNCSPTKKNVQFFDIHLL